jgi:nucleoid DNA-binding protein
VYVSNFEACALTGQTTWAECRDTTFVRPGRNPKTGEDIPITARRVVTFRPGQKLKSRVENASPKAE